MKPLIRWTNLRDDDPIGREVRLARAHAYSAFLTEIEEDDSLHAKLLREEHGVAIELNEESQSDEEAIDQRSGGPLRRRAISAARARANELRRDGLIGDEAFRVVVQELDWAELSAGAGRHQ
jgi:monovalent cation/hydrogen antiporter